MSRQGTNSANLFKMKMFSAFSGIEAASVAFNLLGIETVGLSEIEPFPCALLKHHYPGIKNYGDITRQKEWELPDGIEFAAGGPPCQSFSVSGLRKGLADPRGNLTLEYLAFIERASPRWVLLENVPGILSSNGGRDFGAILGALAELGYGFAYATLDAQNFGVPQRRRRVFIVGHSGGCWQRPAAVLFNQESVFRNPEKGKEEGKEVAGTLGSRATSGGGFSTDFECAGGLQPLDEGGTGGGGQWPKSIAPTLPAAYASKAGLDDQHINDGAGLFVQDELICSSSGQSKASHLKGITPAITRNKDGAPILTEKAFEHRRWEGKTSEVDAASIQARAGTGGGNLPLVSNQQQVRRLPPRECERLQGFPDDYTKIPYRGKPASKCPDGVRYKALGNSWAVPVARWIGERIIAVDKI